MEQNRKRDPRNSADPKTRRQPRSRKTKPKGSKSVILLGFIEFHYDD